MARKFLTGVKELEATLRHLADKEADRISKAAINAGLTVVAKAEKRAAPVGKTGALKASIGKRLERKKRSGLVVAKAGINVGKQSKKQTTKVRAPHSHLVGLGTGPRFRKTKDGRQVSTGSMPANPFIRVAAASSRGAVLAAMSKNAAKSLARAAAKAKK